MKSSWKIWLIHKHDFFFIIILCLISSKYQRQNASISWNVKIYKMFNKDWTYKQAFIIDSMSSNLDKISFLNEE